MKASQIETGDRAAGNPVVLTTALVTLPGWVVREYRDGMFDATNGFALTIGCNSFEAAVARAAELTETPTPRQSCAPECRGRVYGCPKCGKREMTIGETFDHKCPTPRPGEERV